MAAAPPNPHIMDVLSGKKKKPRSSGRKGSGPSGIIKDPRGHGLTAPNGKPIPAAQPAAPPARPIDVRGLQSQLRRAGYEVKVDGLLGPVTKSALADYLKLGKGHSLSPALGSALKGTVITGKRNPKAWNARFATKRPANRPNTGKGGQLTPQGNLQDPPDVLGGAPAGGVAGALDLSGLVGGITTPASSLIPEALAKGGATMFDPAMADKLAGLEFDTAIHDLGVEKARGLRQNVQNLHDVENWYGQVTGAHKTATARDAEIGQAGVGSVKDATAAILGALGGSANAGSSTVAAAGADAVGTLGALDTAQDQFNADLAPLLQSEKAGALQREKAAGASRVQDLALKLADLQGQRGQSVAAHKLELQQANNGIRDARLQRLLEIKGANAGQAQQEFQNRLALANAQLGALVSGAKILGLDGAAGSAKPPKGSFADTTASVRNSLFNQGVSAILDPESGGLLKGLSIPGAVRRVNQIVAGLGWTRKDPNVLAFRNAILQAAGIRPDPRWR